MFDPNAQTVSSRLSKENRRKWFKLAKLSEIPASYFDRMPLIITMLGMGMADDVGQGSSAKDGVETVLQADFEAAEKPISSIEDAAMVLQSLLDLDEDPLIAEVDGYLTNWDGKSIASLFAEPVADGNDDADDSASAKEDGASPDPFAMEHVWARGEGAPDIVEIFNATESGRQLYETLLVDRNRAWAQWLDNRLDAPGTLLVAVGAGHFEGDDSVQAMLEARGLNAKRIH